MGKSSFIIEKRFYSSKVVVFGQNWLYLGKSCCIPSKSLYSGKSGCTRTKWL